MAERIDVFISSTSRDLFQYRDAVTKVVLRLGLHPIIMEAFNPTDRNALQLCYDKVQEAEVFIGIYAHRYGYAPTADITYTTHEGEMLTGDGETSITHLEYVWALQRKLPMLLFVVDENEPWSPKHIEDEPGKSRLMEFKRLIGKNHVWGEFRSPDDLATQVATGLAEAIQQNQLSRQPTKDGSPDRHDFYKHIPLPPNYVPRADLIAKLRLALLGDDNIALTSGIKGATALHGMGGIGKSVMARSLCDDPAIQTAFPNGILWTTLGQEPNLRLKLQEWIEALGGTNTENEPTIDSLKSKLAELLEERTCLLIVDDVWHRSHGEAFRVAGEECRMLMTTRDAEVARSLGARIQPIPTMSETEAVALLIEWSNGVLSDAQPEELTRIVNRLGRLPLAIKLAGAQLQRKTPERWLERFDARKLAEKRQDPEDDSPHISLERCFGMSLDELKAVERKLYAALAIFKEDEPIREQAVRRLWSALDDLDEDEVEELLDDLAARALLEVVGNEFPRAAVLHDLLRDFTAAELDDPKLAHQALLDAYSRTQKGDGWHTVPDDGYFYAHLAYHLMALDQQTTLRNLLLDYAFLQRKLNATNINALIADYEYLPDDDMISLTRSALAMSAHILEDTSQLGSQLWARLFSFREKHPDIASLLNAIDQSSQLNMFIQFQTITMAGGVLLRTLRTEGRGAIWWLDLCREGTLVVTSGEESNVTIWNLETGEVHRVLRGHSSYVVATVSASEDGLTIVSGGHDHMVKVWNGETGEEILTFTDHDQPVWAVELSSDCKTIASADTSGTINVYKRPSVNTHEWSLTYHLTSHLDHESRQAIWEIAISPDNKQMVAGSVDRYLRVWDLTTGEILHSLENAHKRGMGCVSYSPDSQWIYSGGLDGLIKVWDANTGAEIKSIEAHEVAIWGVLPDPTGTYLMSASSDRFIKIWNTADWSLYHSVDTYSLGVWDGDISGNREIAVTGHNNGLLKVWDINPHIESERFPSHKWAIRNVAICSTKNYALSSSSDHTVRVWDMETGNEAQILTGHTATVWGIDVTADEQIVITSSADRTVRLWDLKTGEERKRLEGHHASVRAVAISDDGRIAVSGCGKGMLSIWNLHENTSHFISDAHKGAIRGIALSRDGRRCVTASMDSTLAVWDMENGQQLKLLEGHEQGVYAVDLSADGKLAISASKDKTLRLWNLETGETLKVFEGHWGEVRDVCFCFDDLRVLSASLDNSLRLWSVETGDVLATFTDDINLHACAFDDLKMIAAVGNSLGIVHFVKFKNAQL